MSKVIGVIIAYNAAKTLENLYRRIPKDALDDLILADDGSIDETLIIATRLGIKAFTHERRYYGGNLKFGLQKALEMGGDYLFEIHGDDQYDPSAIIPALEKMRQGYDVVLGSRFTNWRQPLQDGMPLEKYLANLGLSFIARLILRLPLTEFHTGFRGYSRRFLEKTNFEIISDDWLPDFQFIVLAKYLNCKISEVPVRCIYHENRLSINFWQSVIYAIQTFGVLGQYLFTKIGVMGKLFRERQ